ncbi:S8 family serine peptidase [Deinococcus sp.]|uniref:S8 family serine peptidase n=1 Tax=Deinococcus sp. TaxID=47478 RepID=UPI003C7A9D5C
MSRPTVRSLLPLSLALAVGLGVLGLGEFGTGVAIRITTAPPSPPAAVTPVPALPTDPYFPQQWNLTQIGMPAAWAINPGSPVTVAVLDTGYVRSDELTAPAGPTGETNSREINGYDFVSDPVRSGDGDGRDPDASGVGRFAYHAEVVANLIAAARDGQGVVGVNPQAKILHVRVAGEDGMIDPHDLADALRWAAGLSVPGVPLNRQPARVLNLSLFADFIPLTGCDARVNAAVQAVTARGALVVAGAANDAADASGYTPAGCRNVLTVTALRYDGMRASYANWGRSVALAAPGGSLGDPYGDGLPLWSAGKLSLKNGTSFAAPQVSGVASLMLGVNPALTPAALTSMLRASATPFPGGVCDPEHPAFTCGAGLLNAGAALRLAARKEGAASR